MRVVIQRVRSATVTTGGRICGRIDGGLLVFVGIEAADSAADGQWLAEKIVKLRLFDDPDGRMNLSVIDTGGSILVVSQFTLHASTAKGTRPSYQDAARPEVARPLYEQFVTQVTGALGRAVSTGEFGEMMQVSLTNDGPVTLLLDSKARE